MLTLTDLHQQNLILLEALSGSRAYNLATPESDTDIKGVFYLPRHLYYGLGYIPQIANETNDIVYYELGRFIELLLQSNPNTLVDAFRPEWFISLACRQSFAGYALGQIRKARGLNKKIVNPMQPEKKTVLDFCHIIDGINTIPLQHWLNTRNWQQERIGLMNVPHARNLFALFYDTNGTRNYHGVIQKDTANHLALSSIPAGETPQGYLSFNQDGYSSYCREYTSYQTWLAERNEARYQNTASHEQGYDAKNMMHTFRLLQTARDIALYGEIRVWRENREELLAIKRGAFAYEELLVQAEELMAEIDILFTNNAFRLPETTNREAAIAALIKVREKLYG